MTADTLEDIEKDYRAAFPKHTRKGGYASPVGPVDSPLMIVHDMPRRQEVTGLQALSGVAYNIMASMLWGAGKVHLKDCYVTSLLKHEDEAYDDAEVEVALGFLRREVRVVRPNGGVILLLGALVADWVLDIDGLNKHHGKLVTRGPWTFMPTFSPYAIKGTVARDAYVADFAVLGGVLNAAGVERRRTS